MTCFFRWFKKIKESEELDRNFKELKLQRDIWDTYDLLDSKYYYPILLTNRNLSSEEQSLLVHLVLRAVETGLLKRHC